MPQNIFQIETSTRQAHPIHLCNLENFFIHPLPYLNIITNSLHFFFSSSNFKIIHFKSYPLAAVSTTFAKRVASENSRASYNGNMCIKVEGYLTMQLEKKSSAKNYPLCKRGKLVCKNISLSLFSGGKTARYGISVCL